MKSNKLKREPKYIAKFKAFPYQQEAVDAVKDLEYAAIFHEQGLGKTKIAIVCFYIGCQSVRWILL